MTNQTQLRPRWAVARQLTSGADDARRAPRLSPEFPENPEKPFSTISNPPNRQIWMKSNSLRLFRRAFTFFWFGITCAGWFRSRTAGRVTPSPATTSMRWNLESKKKKKKPTILFIVGRIYLWALKKRKQKQSSRSARGMLISGKSCKRGAGMLRKTRISRLLVSRELCVWEVRLERCRNPPWIRPCVSVRERGGEETRGDWEGTRKEESHSWAGNGRFLTRSPCHSQHLAWPLLLNDEFTFDFQCYYITDRMGAVWALFLSQ